MNKHITPLITILTSISLWLIFFNQLPDQVPMQWGFDGSVNWYAPKWIAFLVNNGLFILIYLTLYITPKIDPKRKNYQQFSRAYQIIFQTILIMFFLINLFVLFTSLGYQLNLHAFVPILVGLLFIVFGNYMQTVKQNWFIGIRTPWTLNNTEVWRKTHRLGSKVFILMGFIFMVIPFISDKLMLPVILISVLVVVLIPTGYSYYLHRKLN
ncbi:SdpI family protein [Amphibacillus sp. Q70]|uniref:SdpI family protein n=1 Tax=Amphibacillus sp. Q70 TaxID=3453416 RepID=UPI003F858493